jgi:outer membrane protein W
VGLEGTIGRLSAAAGRFETTALSTTLQLTYYFAARAQFTPFVRLESGVQSLFPYNYRFGKTAFLQGGVSLGAEYMFSNKLGISASVGARHAGADDLDGAAVGSYHDSIWQADLGLTYYGLF